MQLKINSPVLLCCLLLLLLLSLLSLLSLLLLLLLLLLLSRVPSTCYARWPGVQNSKSGIASSFTATLLSSSSSESALSVT